jgi:hypothetical protein
MVRFAFLSLILLLTGCATSNLVTGRRIGPVATKGHAVAPHIVITRLTCVKKTMGKTADEIELYYGNGPLPAHHFFGPVKFTDGKSCEPNTTLELKNLLTIWGVDKDKKTSFYDPHLGIGTLTIPKDAQSGHYQFTFDKNATYILEYDLFSGR